jgi:hypothetical protein
MVYSYITPRNHRYVLETSDRQAETSITLVTTTLPVSLLATCRLLHAEARPIFEPKLAALRDIRYHYVLDFNAYCETVARSDNIVLSIKAQADANLSRVEPRYFLVRRPPMLRGTSEFARVDAFVKTCVGVAQSPWPRVVTIGLRYPAVNVYGRNWLSDYDTFNLMYGLLTKTVGREISVCNAGLLGEKTGEEPREEPQGPSGVGRNWDASHYDDFRY